MGHLRDDDGQTAAEFAGLLVVVAVLVGLVATTGLGARLSSAVDRALCTAFGSGACPAGAELATGGQGGGVPAPGDSDGDGLGDAEEVALGTDPTAFDASFPLPAAPPPPKPDEGSGEHDSDFPTPADYLRYGLAERLAQAAEIKGYTDAARHLRHYLGNSGKPLDVNLARLIEQSPSANATVRQTLQDQMATTYEEALRRYTTNPGQRVVVPIDSGWLNTYATEGNWFYAVGGFSHAYTGTMVLEPPATPGGEPTVRIEYQMHMYDYYNWDKGKSVNIGPVTITDEDLQELHRAGLAQEYVITGSTETVVVEGPASEVLGGGGPGGVPLPPADDREGGRDDPGRGFDDPPPEPRVGP